jgi:hypothetical protein
MTPTDAQIEAAAQAMWERCHDGTWRDGNACDDEAQNIYIEDARAALTAAAEVGLRPTAEAKPPLITQTFPAWEESLNDARAAEREACARVADEMQLYTAWDIAAAIRARKDT